MASVFKLREVRVCFFGFGPPESDSLWPPSILLRWRARHAFSLSHVVIILYESVQQSNQNQMKINQLVLELINWSNGSCSRLLSFGIWAKVLRLKAEDSLELFLACFLASVNSLVEGSIQSIDKTGVDFVAQEDQKVILPQGIHPVAGTFKGGRACERCATEYVYMFILGTRSDSKSKLCLVATAEGIPLLDAVKSSTKESRDY
ncbi:hypothetical protein Bca4012_072548 [Brassica carinata]